jgi:predicted NUDIX family NTP pyrophosphohydrolase
MAKQSAGILLFRRLGEPEFFLVHPGGPIWLGKEDGAWSIPKGEFIEEEPLDAARREFLEETGQVVSGEFLPLTPIIQKAGKKVFAWAVEGDIDAEAIQSNHFEMEWPRKSGIRKSFPEVDKAGWFTASVARQKINVSQAAFIDELLGMLVN